MMTTNESLQALITRICDHPEPHSSERRRLLNHLLMQLQQLPGIRRSSHPDYLEALDRTWEWVSSNIDKFKPRLDEPMTASLPSFPSSLLGNAHRKLLLPIWSEKRELPPTAAKLPFGSKEAEPLHSADLPFVTTVFPFVTTIFPFATIAVLSVTTVFPFVTIAIPLITTALLFLMTVFPFVTTTVPFQAKVNMGVTSVFPFLPTTWVEDAIACIS